MSDPFQIAMANQPMGDALAHLEMYARPVEPPKADDNWEAFARGYPEKAAWIVRQRDSFPFASAMLVAVNRYGSLTRGQHQAIENCMRYERRHTPTGREESQPQVQELPKLDLSRIPSGNYAIPQGETRLKLSISRGTGKWAGYIFVTDAAVYGSGRRYGMQRPGQWYNGAVSEQLKIIAADPRSAAAAYGKLTGTCGVCGRKLEDEESVARGIGPICMGKF